MSESRGTMPASPNARALDANDQFVLSELLNHVLDKGVVITGHVTISVADIDLVALDLRLVLSSVETAMRHGVHTTKP